MSCELGVLTLFLLSSCAATVTSMLMVVSAFRLCSSTTAPAVRCTADAQRECVFAGLCHPAPLYCRPLQIAPFFHRSPPPAPTFQFARRQTRPEHALRWHKDRSRERRANHKGELHPPFLLCCRLATLNANTCVCVCVCVCVCCNTPANQLAACSCFGAAYVNCRCLRFDQQKK